MQNIGADRDSVSGCLQYWLKIKTVCPNADIIGLLAFPPGVVQAEHRYCFTVSRCSG